MSATSPRVPFGDTSRATVLFIPTAVRARVHVRGARVHVTRWGHGRQALVFPRGGAYSVAIG